MPTLLVLEKDEVKTEIPFTSVYQAIDYVKKNSKDISIRTYVYSTINEETKIENTITIRP